MGPCRNARYPKQWSAAELNRISLPRRSPGRRAGSQDRLEDRMENSTQQRFSALLSSGSGTPSQQPSLTSSSALKLLDRTSNVPFFAHSYTFYHNMIDGFTPHDLARFAYEHDLHGMCLHISDGNSLNVRGMTPAQRDAFRAQ